MNSFEFQGKSFSINKYKIHEHVNLIRKGTMKDHTLLQAHFGRASHCFSSTSTKLYVQKLQFFSVLSKRRNHAKEQRQVSFHLLIVTVFILFECITKGQDQIRTNHLIRFIFTLGKGGKNRRRGKNEGDAFKRELIYKEEGQEYGQVIKILGNARVDVNCFDGRKRLAHIRGKMRKKVLTFECISVIL